MILKFLSLY